MVEIRKRRFIHIDEIEHKTDLTKGDVFDAVENGRMSLCAFIDEQGLGFVLPRVQPQTIGAVFDFRGVVQLSKKVSQNFAMKHQEQKVSGFVILEKEKAKQWRSLADEYGEIKHSRINFLQEVSEKPDRPFSAVPIYYGMDPGQNFLNVVSNFLEAKVKEQGGSLPPIEGLDNNNYLQLNSIDIKPEQLRVDLYDIADVFVESYGAEGLFDWNAIDEALNQSEDNTHVLTHPIEQIVYRVLEEQPKLRADKVWNLIRAEFQQDTERKYDIDAVIDSMSQDHICWFGKDVDTENRMTYGSFRKNTVADVRKYLKSM